MEIEHGPVENNIPADNAASGGVITDIYFYQADSTDLIASISIYDDSGVGVDYSVDATPGKLGTSPYTYNADFAVQPNNPQPIAKSIGRTEWIEIRADLESGITYDDLINALESGSLVVAFHLQSLPGGVKGQ